MKNAFAMMATLAFVLAGGAQTRAGSEYSLYYSDGTNVASGLIDVTAGGLVDSGTLDVTAGAAVGVYPLIPGGPEVFLSPLGNFDVDNVVYIGSNPALDVDGLLFGSGPIELNIWGNSPGNYSFYASIGANGSDYFVSFAGPATFTLTAVPEPSSIALAAIGGIGLFGCRRYFYRPTSKRDRAAL